MQFLVLLGAHVNSKLFYASKDECETAMKRVLHDRAQWLDTGKDDKTAQDYFEIRDDYDGYSIMMFSDFKGFILNSSEGNEETTIQVTVANKVAEFKTQTRLQAVGDSMIIPAKRVQ